jgi:predicted RNase H-like HicB family nuclease
LKLIYPACFYPEENGQYTVIFPDLNEIATYGNSLEDAIEMASDLGGGWLLNLIQDTKQLPSPSDIRNITPVDTTGFVSLITIDLTEFEKKHGTKSVKKTLTLPAWMNTLAEKKNVNFSALLQEGIKKHLNL